MIKLHQLIASVFGIGYIKGGGTIAAAACCFVWMATSAGNLSGYWQFFILAVCCLLGIWSGNVVDAAWGKDSSRVVIDEVAGMLVTLILIPVEVKNVIAGLILFRFFDIAKPLFIRKLEALPKGWGVMADDVLAGVYANVLLQVIVRIG